MDQTPAAMDRHLEVIQCHPGKSRFFRFWLIFAKKLRENKLNVPLPLSLH